MKKTIFLFALSMCLAFASCTKEEPAVETRFELVTESVEIVAEGGSAEIQYILENPAEGTEITASTEDEWICDLNCDESEVIRFNVLANDTFDARSGIITVSGAGKTFDVPVKQEGLEAPVYDVEITCTELVQASYWGDQTFYYNHNYFLNFSDYTVDDFGRYDEEGTYFKLNLLGPAPENKKDPRLPAGTYTYDPENTFDEWTFSQEHSSVMAKYVELSYEEATLVVSYEKDICTIDLVATLSDGKTYHARYEGDGAFLDSSIEWVDHDINVEAIDAFSFFIEEMPSAKYNANLNIKFIDSPLDDMGYITPPGNIVTIIANVELSATGKIIPGTWTVAEEGENIMFPGYCTRFFGPYPAGTMIQSNDADNNVTAALVESGTLTVSGGEDDVYTFEYEFTTEQGKKITGSYTGPLVVEGAPVEDEYSKYYLTEDYVLEFPDQTDTYFRVSGMCSKYTYSGKAAWTLKFMQYNTNYQYDGDIIEIQFVCSLDYLDEPMEGTYTVAETAGEEGTVSPGKFQPGESYNTFIPTYFRKAEKGNTLFGGAATDGELKLTKNDDGTWTVEFDFIDQQKNPKHFSGSWTGVIDF